MTTEEQRKDPVIRDAQLEVLGKVRSERELDWLEKAVLRGILGGRVGMCQEVKDLVKEMKASGEL